MKIKTIKQYADSKGITTQAVPQLKKLHIVTLPLIAEYDGERVEVGKRKFVIEK